MNVFLLAIQKEGFLFTLTHLGCLIDIHYRLYKFRKSVKAVSRSLKCLDDN